MHCFTCNASLPYLYEGENKQTNKKSKYLAAFKQCVSHLSLKQDKRVSLCLFLGSGMIFQVSGQGMGSLLCRNSGFAWGLGSGAVQVCGILRGGWEGGTEMPKAGLGHCTARACTAPAQISAASSSAPHKLLLFGHPNPPGKHLCLVSRRNTLSLFMKLVMGMN